MKRGDFGMHDGTTGWAGDDFVRVIAPMAPETFFSDYFEKRHLVIHRERTDHYGDLLSIADIDRVLTTTILPVADLQLVNNGQSIPPEDYGNVHGQVDAVRVTRHFSQGSTIVLPQLHRRLPRLAAYCRALEAVFSCDLQTNIYLTPDNAQGFKTHYDSHDVFVLQVHGTKTWRIYDSPLQLPMRSQAFDPATFVPGEVIETFVLGPGDMAYLPRGVVHDAIATDEVSLHITTGLLGRRWIDLLLEAVAEQALADPAFRASIPPGYAAPGFDRGPARERFRELLARVVERADPDRALDSFAAEFRSKRLPVVPGQFLQHAAAEGVGAQTLVGVRPDLTWTLRADPPAEGAEEGEIVLEVYGAEIAFPVYVEQTLRDALARDRIRTGDLAGDLDDAGKAVLVRRLVREGVLRILG